MPGRQSFSASWASAYLVLSALFACLYFWRTDGWTGRQLASYTLGLGAYPGEHLLFEGRILIPLIARWCSRVLPVSLPWIYRGIAWLSVVGALESFRWYLAGFMESRHARLLASTLLYPMVWNLCIMNRIYFPFDLPAILLFILGLHFMHARRWAWYYSILIVSLLNHEAAALLVAVFWLTSGDSMPARARWVHSAFQIAIVVSVKGATCLAQGWGGDEFGGVWRAGTYASVNARTLWAMLTLQGEGLRDWAKLALAFGGLWMVLPLARRRAPPFLARALWSGVVYTGILGFTAIIDEVRGYGVLVPIVLAPVVCLVAGKRDRGAMRHPLGSWHVA
jgi:hypothetical protein